MFKKSGLLLFILFQILSKKISLLYKQCRDGLSNPLNNTFDLRSLKLVIRTARYLLINQPELEESLAIMKILRLAQLNTNDNNKYQ